jgi:dihydroxyacetone kinase
MTALDMAGFQITLLRFTAPKTRDRWLALLDAPTEAPAWPSRSHYAPGEHRVTPARLKLPPVKDNLIEDMIQAAKKVPFVYKLTEEEVKQCKEAVLAVNSALKKEEHLLNALDSGVGDGDTGSTLLSGTKGNKPSGSLSILSYCQKK